MQEQAFSSGSGGKGLTFVRHIAVIVDDSGFLGVMVRSVWWVVVGHGVFVIVRTITTTAETMLQCLFVSLICTDVAMNEIPFSSTAMLAFYPEKMGNVQGRVCVCSGISRRKKLNVDNVGKGKERYSCVDEWKVLCPDE